MLLDLLGEGQSLMVILRLTDFRTPLNKLD
jgi:hypothetical protein